MEAIARYSLEIGLLYRGGYKRTISAKCFEMGLDLDIKEDKGWFTSLIMLTIKGPADKVRLFSRWVNAFHDALSDEE